MDFESNQKLSQATLSRFNPVIPYQLKLLQDLRLNFDYSLGAHEILLSGSVGSSKSTIAAHAAVTHCLMYPRSRVLICRRTLPDVKRTIYLKCLEHIGNDLIEGKQYYTNSTQASIHFDNGSEIISTSWADKRYMKVRSLDLSAVIVEEIIENAGDDVTAYSEIKMRVGRLPHVPENWIISCTNPGSPSDHWYKYFILDKKPTKHVYYSITTDNPFLPPQYIEQLKNDLDPQLAKRMIYGQWIDLKESVIYHQYNRDIHFKQTPYEVKPVAPIHLSFDFNIGEGKPMSCVFFQFINDTFHFFDEAIVEGADTEQLLIEMAARGLLDHTNTYVLHGDATGKARHSASKKSDYDIIKEFFDKYRNKHGNKINLKVEVPLSNPPVRARHNIVNTYLRNANGQIRLYLYAPCKVLDEGLRLTKLKKGGNYIEDDSKFYQHCTTALGYGIVSCIRKPDGTFNEIDRWKIWQF